MKKLINKAGILFAALALLGVAHTADAQVHTYKYPETNSGLGKIGGKITGDLRPVEGARVQLLKNDEVIDEKITDENGCYTFMYLDPGCYDVKGVKEGFRTHLITHIPAFAERTTPTDFYLPKINSCNMPRYPVVEAYHYPKKWVKDLVREDYSIYVNKPLSRDDD